MGVIAILGTITAELKPVLYIRACQITGSTDVQALNAAPVIGVGIVFLLYEFANMKSLDTNCS